MVARWLAARLGVARGRDVEAVPVDPRDDGRRLRGRGRVSGGGGGLVVYYSFFLFL